MRPGAIVLIKILYEANSDANDLDSPTIPVRNVLESIKPGSGSLIEDEAMLRIFPPSFFR
jgi:hypothetical protein